MLYMGSYNITPSLSITLLLHEGIVILMMRREFGISRSIT